jgi:transposase
MPSPLFARPPADPAEERRIRKLANARQAPASWRQRARIVAASWDGAQVTRIAEGLDCHPMTVYRWLHRFNTDGLDGLADLPRSGRPPRLTELDRGQVIALARSIPPGRLTRQPDGTLGLAEAAQAQGIQVSRSQVRTILLREGVRWRPVRSWATSPDPDFAPKGRPSSPSTPPRRQA